MVLFLPLYLFWVFIDYQRKNKANIAEIFNKFFGGIIRESEIKSYTGATYLGLGILITTILFHKHTAIMAMSVLAVSDSLAAIIGTRYGHIKVGEKSLEGSAAFFVSGVMVICFFNWFLGMKAIYLWENIFALLVATLFELYSKKMKLNDNLLIPIVYALIVSMLESTI